MICIYHNRDFDGFCSAAIVKRKYPDAKFIGWDYGMPLPELPEGEEIIMVDISFPMNDMLEVAKKSHWQLTWIDHHKSAIEDFNKYTEDRESFCNAFLNSSIAACENVWRLLFPSDQLPMGVRLLGEYDSWRNQDKINWNEYVMPFQMGMKLICNSLDNFPSEIFGENGMEFCVPAIETGRIILQYQEMQNEARCKNSAFERTFSGLRAICLISVIGSQSFKSIWDPEKYDIMIAASYTKDRWTISLYTEKPEIDVSTICKKYGGGGHRGAAGFITDDISLITGSDGII